MSTKKSEVANQVLDKVIELSDDHCDPFGDDSHYMEIAIKLAHEAAQRREVPVGAVVVHRNQVSKESRIVGLGFNLRETTHDPSAHAELVAMRRAAQVLGQWRLNECTLYVTLEPCPMCAGAIVNARVQRVVYGCDDPKAGAVRSLYRLIDDQRLNHRAELRCGLESQRCSQVLKDFFAMRRAEKQALRKTKTQGDD